MSFHLCLSFYFFFFFNDTATTEIYTLSLHDALPIYRGGARRTRAATPHAHDNGRSMPETPEQLYERARDALRSEEHTSELQSQSNLVCRLLPETTKDATRYTLRTVSVFRVSNIDSIT